MASEEREPITGVWRQSTQRGPGAEPLVRGQSPPEAESLSAFQRPMKTTNVPPLTVSGKLSVCDVSTTLNRIQNTSLLRTGGLKQLRETAHLTMDSGQSSNISGI